MTELKIKQEFKDLIHPLTPEEKSELEKGILDKGCLDKLKTWQGFLIDGHHRYDICQKHSIPFETDPMEFEDEDSVKVWMINNQMGRRNITDAGKIKYALLSEDIEKERARKRQACGQGGVLLRENFRGANEEKGKVSQIIGKKIGVSDRTVEKFKVVQEKASEEVVKALCEGTPINGKKLSIDKVYREVQKNEKKEVLKATEFPKGKYRVIYADPPWDYGSSPTCKNTATPDLKYPVMSLEDICELPVKEIADENAVLFLWTTSYHIFESKAVLDAWGFEYKSMFIWDKVKHNMGCYNSVRHELLLIATKGSCTPDNVELIDSVQSIERTRHSEKPEEFRKIIETLYKYGNKVECFARKQTEGWDAYGNDIKGE